MTDVEEEFKKLTEPSIVLITSKAEDALKTNIKILKILTKDRTGLYITINQPYESLQKILKKNEIDTSKMFFIDCITKTVSGAPERTKNCLFVASPSGITELGISITEALHMISGDKRFLFMDSLSTLLIYNSAGTIAKFSHFLMSKIKLLGLNGIFMSIEKEMDEKLLAEISHFCDKVIRV